MLKTTEREATSVVINTVHTRTAGCSTKSGSGICSGLAAGAEDLNVWEFDTGGRLQNRVIPGWDPIIQERCGIDKLANVASANGEVADLSVILTCSKL